jgi:hypothetical protein
LQFVTQSVRFAARFLVRELCSYENGRKLKKMCHNYNLKTLNNLSTHGQNFDGDFTYNKDGRRSQVDICLVNTSALEAVTSFNIHHIPINFSDHAPISVELSFEINSTIPTSQVTADILSNNGEDSDRKPPKLPTNINWDAYAATATKDLEQLKQNLTIVREFTQETVDTIVNDVNTIITRSANAYKVDDKTVEDAPVLNDGERSVQQISKDISAKEIESWNSILNSKNPKELWEKISWKDSTSDSNMKYPSAEALGEHFQQKSIINDEVPFAFTTTNYVDVLDDPISDKEVQDASNKLKENKSTADGWSPKHVTSIAGALFAILSILMNVILRCSIYPSQWRTTIVSAIFKNKGSSFLPKFYRPISLVHLLSKFFDFILLGRFIKWFVPHDLQSAYQKFKSVADPVFLLRCLILYTKKHNKKLFVICIDFEGAFDKVSRHKLFTKLQLFGVGTLFLSCLISIYALTDCVIYQKETTFTYHLLAGIKQGLPLSPWLFLFYINDIFDYFHAIFGCDGVLEIIHLLIHADDTTLLASSREAAERKFKAMLQYCRMNHISLQVSKCEFIVINGDESDREPFIFGDDRIDNVPYLSLLGSHLSQTGKLEEDLELHISKRRLAVHKFYNFMRANKLAPVPVKLKVLHACVASSLLHNCETFGSKVPKALETTYYSLIKSCLGVRSNTPNLLVLVESGMPSLESMIRARQFSFFNNFVARLKVNSPKKTVFDAIQESKNEYIQHYVNLLILHKSKDEIQQHYANKLISEVNDLAASNDNYKFRLYKLFNPDLKPLDLRNVPYKFPRLRLSAHRMPIETGRWRRLKREERTCVSCETLGDEEHYIYTCPEIDRTDLTDIPPFHELEHYNKLYILIERIDDYL